MAPGKQLQMLTFLDHKGQVVSEHGRFQSIDLQEDFNVQPGERIVGVLFRRGEGYHEAAMFDFAFIVAHSQEKLCLLKMMQRRTEIKT